MLTVFPPRRPQRTRLEKEKFAGKKIAKTIAVVSSMDCESPSDPGNRDSVTPTHSVSAARIRNVGARLQLLTWSPTDCNKDLHLKTNTPCHTNTQHIPRDHSCGTK